VSERTARIVGLYSVVAGAAAIVVSPLLAMSYFAIDDGKDELDTATVSAWAKPGRDLAGGLLTFASADRVYATYIQLFLLLAPAILLCAWAVRSRRPASMGRFERWGWRIALVGYACLLVGGITVSLMLVKASPNGNFVNVPFLLLIVPGILISTIGSVVLGIALIRAGYRPRLTTWILAVAFPLWIVGSDVLGHNSIGLTPILVAWGLSGWRLWRPGPAIAR
jgi:hypothetical protein